MLDVRRLKLLSELSRRGTIADVARIVGYTPSAVSQSLARLEREAGVPLLERDGRRVRLTPAAARLVERVDRVLIELDAAESELAADHQVVQGTIAIGALPSAATGLVIPAVTALSRRHPDLVCSVHEHEPPEGIPLLRSGDLDLLVSESNDDIEPPRAGGLEAHPLLTEPLLLVLPRSTELPPGPVRLEAFRDASWIAGPTGTQYEAAVERACRSAGFAPRIVHRADEAVVVQSLAAAGLGVALLPALACADGRAVRYTPVLPEPPRRHVTALVRRGAVRRPALAATLNALQHQASEAQASIERWSPRTGRGPSCLPTQPG